MSVFCATASAQDVEFVSSFRLAAVHDVIVADTLLYIASLQNLVILNISNPNSPVFVKEYFTANYLYSLDISGDYLYLANSSDGMQIINISDPLRAKCEGVIDTDGGVMGIMVCDGLAYLADGVGLQIVDVSIPSDPIVIGSYKSRGNSQDVYVADGFAYVAFKSAGLQIIDVSNPSLPTLVGTYGQRCTVRDVRVIDGYAYVAAGPCGLLVIDVINPAEPKLVGSYDTPDDALGVCYFDGYVYVADDSSLQIINVSIPSAPAWAGSYNSRGIARRIYIVDDYAYMTNFFSMLIFRVRQAGAEVAIEDSDFLPTKFTLYQNYPNPFNSTTIIKFELPSQVKVTIEIYDIQGRKAATLIDEQLQAGSHSVLWNAGNFSSGVYFYAIHAGDFTESKQMMLLK